MAFDAAMKAPSGDQLRDQLTPKVGSALHIPESSEESAGWRILERLGYDFLQTPVLGVPDSHRSIVRLDL